MILAYNSYFCTIRQLLLAISISLILSCLLVKSYCEEEWSLLPHSFIYESIYSYQYGLIDVCFIP